MYQHELRPSAGAHKRRRRLGRGHGSGRGTTAGRGTKGQKSRSGGKVNPRFEGGQNPLVLRMPQKRGFTNIHRVEYSEVNLMALARFEADTEVTPEMLWSSRVVREKKLPVKVLGHGDIDRALVIHAHKFSASAREKIEAAGGKAMVIGAADVTPEEA
jgi:large subunit ribosomal protein L15